MKISFIILNYKQKGLTKQCVKGIISSNIKLQYEIIVVDNNSKDGCIEMLKKLFPQVMAIQSDINGGYSHGNNLGIKKAKGEYIAILNPDVAVTEGSLEKIISFFSNHPMAGIVGPKLLNPDGSTQYSCRRFPTLLTPIFRRTFLKNTRLAKKNLKSYLMIDWDHKENKKVDWLFGAFLLIRKEALEKVGYFDERFKLYFEDCDLCRRFWENGYEVWYTTEVELIHYHQRLSDQKSGITSVFKKGTRLHIRSAFQYFLKYKKAELPKKT